MPAKQAYPPISFQKQKNHHLILQQFQLILGSNKWLISIFTKN